MRKQYTDWGRAMVGYSALKAIWHDCLSASIIDRIFSFAWSSIFDSIATSEAIKWKTIQFIFTISLLIYFFRITILFVLLKAEISSFHSMKSLLNYVYIFIWILHLFVCV